eukprot:gene26856-35223_t
MLKRQYTDPQDDEEDDSSEFENIKRSRIQENEISSALIEVKNSSTALVVGSSGRKSLLAEDLSLSGHEGAIYSICFDPSGNHLCSSSFDRQIFLWDVFGEGKNYNVLSGHKNAVLEVKWGTEQTIVSCSADKTVAIWNANLGTRVRKLTEHTGIVNSVDIAKNDPNVIASASDDCTVCSVCLSADGQYVFSGGIDNIIRRFDVRMGDSESRRRVAAIELHGLLSQMLGCSPFRRLLLALADYCYYNCYCKFVLYGSSEHEHIWSVGERCLKTVLGAHHGAEKLLLKCSWSPDQDRISCGSADRYVHLWETTTFSELYYLPGHKASVNQVIFHPTQPILASCGSDRQIILGEY